MTDGYKNLIEQEAEHSVEAGPRDDRLAALESEQDELQKLLTALNITDADRIEWIKDAAMNRHNVKKSHRPGIRRILDEAIGMLMQEGGGR